MAKKMLIAFALFIILPSALVSIFKFNPSQFFSPKPQSKFDLKPSQIEKLLKNLDQDLVQVETLIEQSKYADARSLYNSLFEKFNSLKGVSGQKPLDGGRTLNSELARQETRIGDAARRRFDQLMIPIEQGGNDTASVHRLANTFVNVGQSDLVNLLKARSPALDAKRRALAPRWIRIVHEGADDTFDPMVTAVIAKASLPAGYTVVHGPAMGPDEAAATFSTITIKIATYYAGYDLVSKGVSSGGQPHDSILGGGDLLLTNLEVTINVRPAFRDYPTSWDDVGKPSDARNNDRNIVFSYTIPALDSTTVRDEEEFHEKFAEFNHQRSAMLQAKLARDLAKLPVLDFIPDRNSSLPLISRQSALLDQPAFVQAASADLAADRSLALIANIAAELCIEPLADEIENHLGSLTREEQRQLAQILKTRPWFHDGRTVGKLAATAALDTSPLPTEAARIDLAKDAAKVERTLRAMPLDEQVSLIVQFAQGNPNQPWSTAATRSTPGNAASTSRVTLHEFLQKPDRASAANYLRLQSQHNTPEEALKLSKALAEALNRANRGQDLELLPDEQAIFLRALEINQGKQREAVINSLPKSAKLFSLLLQKHLPTWDGPQTIAFCQFAERILGPEDGARGGPLVVRLMQAYRDGLFNTPELRAAVKGTLGSGCCRYYYMWRGPAEDMTQKISLIAQILDTKTPEDPDFFASPLGSLLGNVGAANLLKNPNARTILTKAKTYPNRRVNLIVRELITEAAKINPAYGKL